MNIRFKRHRPQSPGGVEAAIEADRTLAVNKVEVDEEAASATISYIGSNAKREGPIVDFVKKEPSAAIALVEAANHQELEDSKSMPAKTFRGLADAAIRAARENPEHPLSERVGRVIVKKALGEFATSGIAVVEFPERTTQQVADNGEYQPETRPARVLIIPNHPA